MSDSTKASRRLQAATSSGQGSVSPPKSESPVKMGRPVKFPVIFAGWHGLQKHYLYLVCVRAKLDRERAPGEPRITYADALRHVVDTAIQHDGWKDTLSR